MITSSDENSNSFRRRAHRRKYRAFFNGRVSVRSGAAKPCVRRFKIFGVCSVTRDLPVADRPDGSRLLSDARAKKFDTILVYKLDRLARSTLEILKAVETLGQWDIAIKSMTEPFETDSSVGKFLVSMLASVAQLERDAIRDRSGAGMDVHVCYPEFLSPVSTVVNYLTCA
jgi:Resolvase, N terminal domain